MIPPAPAVASAGLIALPLPTTLAVTRASRSMHMHSPVFPSLHHLTSPSKHTGIEKAVHQIEQAIKRNGRSSDEPQDRAELRRLLDRSRDLLNSDPASRRARDSQEGPSPQHTIASQDTPPSFVGSSSRDGGRAHSTEDEKLNLDDAENPLQLLARTSELLSTIDPHVTGSAEGRSAARLGPHRENDLQRFFGGFNPRLDVGDELDPIELGLMTLAEAEALFT